MNLVEATRDDVDLLAKYWYRLASGMEPYSALNELALDGPEDAVGGIEEHLIDDEDRTPFLLEVAGEPVGFLLLHDGDHPSRELDSYVEIVDLYVAEGHRDEGHGTAAIETVKEIARERGGDYVKVGYERDNEGARRCYEDNGFAERHLTYVQRVD
jgi:ribosomal protein S18 acetylase RimI-like enzyme